MTAIGAANGASQISPANERVYHQSNLIGDWKGTWRNNQVVELKVVSINGDAATVEYTHNGHTERGIGTVSGNSISYGDVTIGTRDGKVAAIEFAAGSAKMTGVLAKSTAAADQDRLVGTWTGTSATNGQAATVQVLSISGRDAQVKFTVNGSSQQGVGTVYKNVVMFGKEQISTSDGLNGTVTFPAGHQTLTVSVKKYTPPSSTSSSVNVVA